MTELNEQQITFISEYLEQHLFKFIPLREELLDHLCCMIEAKMDQGLSFHQATEQVLELYSESTLQKIEKQTIQSHQNSNKIMTKFSLAMICTIMMTFTTIFGLPYDPPSGSPIGGDYHITSHFGMRMHPIQKKKKMHQGIDFRAPIGTPILATSSGVIAKVVHQKTGYGNYVVIQHDNTYETKYSQLSEIKVEVGQEIEKGQVIALSGNSGASTGPHLHYEVLKDGVHVDPKDYLKP